MEARLYYKMVGNYISVMKEALFYKKLRDAVQCELCARGCVIPEGRVGFCRTRKNIKGKLYNLTYGRLCSYRHRPCGEETALPLCSRFARLIYIDSGLHLQLQVLPATIRYRRSGRTSQARVHAKGYSRRREEPRLSRNILHLHRADGPDRILHRERQDSEEEWPLH